MLSENRRDAILVKTAEALYTRNDPKFNAAYDSGRATRAGASLPPPGGGIFSAALDKAKDNVTQQMASRATKQFKFAPQSPARDDMPAVARTLMARRAAPPPSVPPPAVPRS